MLRDGIILPSGGQYNAIQRKKSVGYLQQAVEQIRKYAEAPRVETLRQGTTLHKIIMQFEGWNLKRMEEIN